MTIYSLPLAGEGEQGPAMTQPNPPQNATGLLLSDDLIFTSRVVGTARDLGFQIRTARNQEMLLQMAAERLPACIIVDLSNPGLAIETVTQRLPELGQPRPFVVAYGSHVDVLTLTAAREAGCDRVMPRSKFVEVLQTALPDWFGAT